MGVQPTFELNSLVSQNHQVPTRGKSRYFFFLPFVRQSRSVTIVHSSYVKCVSFQRERERGRCSGWRILLIFHQMVFFLCRIYPIVIKYPVTSPRGKADAFPMPRKENEKREKFNPRTSASKTSSISSLRVVGLQECTNTSGRSTNL